MSKKKWFFVIVLGFWVAWNAVVQAQQDQVTITTYFPSPDGVFSYMRANRSTISLTAAFVGGVGNLNWGGANSMGVLRSDQGSSIELGRSTGGQPYVRFNKNAITTRIQLFDDNTLRIYVWNNLSVYDPDANAWKDLYVYRVFYHWGWANGTINQTNLKVM